MVRLQVESNTPAMYLPRQDGQKNVTFFLNEKFLWGEGFWSNDLFA